jgi:hypothetical protein
VLCDERRQRVPLQHNVHHGQKAKIAPAAAVTKLAPMDAEYLREFAGTYLEDSHFLGAVAEARI